MITAICLILLIGGFLGWFGSPTTFWLGSAAMVLGIWLYMDQVQPHVYWPNDPSIYVDRP